MTYESVSPTGDEVQVDPELLASQGDRFAQLGDVLRRHAANHPVRSPHLGTSPPAVKFAQRLAALTGDTGAVALIAAWGGGLMSMAVNQRDAAATYTETDTGNADAFRGTSTDI